MTNVSAAPRTDGPVVECKDNVCIDGSCLPTNNKPDCTVCTNGRCIAGVCTPDSATLVLNPSSISAQSVWPGMPANINQSDITVTWNPPECEGTLQIVEIEGTGGYVPPNQGTLTQTSPTVWQYTAFDEPQTALCPQFVKVWIAAIKDGVELTRVNVLVQPVHTWWTKSNPPNFQNDYDYIVWKYATVHATTGGAFSSVTISTDTCVPCPRFWLDPFPPCVAACTNVGDDSVKFGTQAFAGSENATASTIGHEMVHTTPAGESECSAYTWEVNNAQQTGVAPCDGVYLDDISQRQKSKCP